MSNGPGPYPPHEGYPGPGPQAGYPPPPAQPYPPPHYPPPPGHPYPPPGWGPPRRSKLGLYIGIFIAAWILISIVAVALLASGVFNDAKSGSSAASRSSTGSTATAGGIDENWLGGRWCSGVDSVTFRPADRSFYMSAQQQGSYTLVGNQLTMTAPGGASNIVTITRLGQDSLTMSSPGQGSETARRC